jgi:arylformamidase
MTVDYEAGYDNRAHVPEHPQIFARYAREAAAFREEAAAKGQATLGVSYGPSPRQMIDIFAPSPNGPVAMFIHGGYWRATDPSMYSQCTRGLFAHGVTVAVAGYDLSPQVTLAAIIEQMRQAGIALWKRCRRPILAYGHSAGGHLAACLLATDWKALDSELPADLVPAACAISGVFDLTPLVHTSMNADYKLTEEAARTISPLYWPAPDGRVLDAVVGGAELSEFLRQSRTMADTWGSGGTRTRYEEIPGANHFTAIDPLTDPSSPMVARLLELAKI